MFVFLSTAIFPPLQILLSFFVFFFPYKLIFQVLILFEGNFNYLKWLNILPCSSFKMVTSLHWLNGTILWKKHVIISLNTEWSRDFIIVFMFLWFFFNFLIIFYQKLSKTEQMRGGDFPCVVMMNLFFGKLLLGIKLQQFTLQAKENNLILTE